MYSYNDIDRDFLEIMLMKNVLKEDISGMLDNHSKKFRDTYTVDKKEKIIENKKVIKKSA